MFRGWTDRNSKEQSGTESILERGAAGVGLSPGNVLNLVIIII